MIYVFLGKDFNIVKIKIDELINSLNIENIIKYDFAESSISEILDEVNFVDLFNDKKLIIVSNFSFKNLSETDEEKLSRYIDNMNENVIIFRCIDESIDERRKLTKLLKSKCKIEKIEKLDYKNLHAYVSNVFKDNNLKASFNQIKKILDLCEYNVDYTLSEIDKLLIYKIGSKELYDKDIDDVISRNHEKEIFTFTNYVLKKDIGHALDSLKILLSSDADEVVIIDALARQYRLLYQVKLLKGTLKDEELARVLKVKDYTITKTSEFINNYSEEEILNKLYKLSECDINIKASGYDKNKVLESFILSL